MTYLTGIFALNLTCSLNTCGDWHQSSLRWEKPFFCESNQSISGVYGIEHILLPKYLQQYFATPMIYCAHHIRACLDCMEINNLSLVQGMRKDFICVSEYDNEIFYQVMQLKPVSHWPAIDAFMLKEYNTKWKIYRNNFEYSHCSNREIVYA